MVTNADGIELVQLARKAVQHYLDNETVLETNKAGPTSGLFVTLNSLTRSEEHLRGCVGFLKGYKRLHPSVIEAAIAAATQDPRFPPVSRRELPKIIFELSVLTEPFEVIEHNDILVGRDGLILHWKYALAFFCHKYQWNWDGMLTNT